ncbi:hypothetical protein G9A89_016882 [Geosiphon pyriformis]|nr:hypothetical protein G9A89_016882 [Geosiphon pyriformis]
MLPSKYGDQKNPHRKNGGTKRQFNDNSFFHEALPFDTLKIPLKKSIKDQIDGDISYCVCNVEKILMRLSSNKLPRLRHLIMK